MKRKLAVLFMFAVVALFLVLLLKDQSRKSYLYFDFGAEIPEDYNLLGIDISHHQGEINWPQVDSMSVNGDSIQFVYIKATEGITFEDDRWKENAEGAESVNIPFGLYHFFKPSYSARKQAVFFAEKCLAANDTLRPMLDVETNAGFGKQRLVDSVHVFITTFEKRMKMKPVIYTYESFFDDNFADSYLKNEWFWIANYNRECKALSLDNVVIWQFSERGTVNGIDGKVDLNVAKDSFREVMFQD